MPRLLLITVLLIFLHITLFAQDTIHIDVGGNPVTAVVKDGDTLYISQLEEAVIQPVKRKATNRDLRQYRRLIYNVKKVYPYAKLAGVKFKEVNDHLMTLKTDKERREYIKTG